MLTAKKPNIRRVTMPVPKKPDPAKPQEKVESPKQDQSQKMKRLPPKQSKSAEKVSQRSSSAPTPTTQIAPRPRKTSSAPRNGRPEKRRAEGSPELLKPPAPSKRTRTRKATPVEQRLTSDSDSDSDDLTELLNKRRRTTDSLDPDVNRRIRDTSASTEHTGPLAFVHCTDLMLNSGGTRDTPALHDAENESIEVADLELRYPGARQTEKFRIIWPQRKDDFNPVEDMIQCVDSICEFYFPESQIKTLTGDMNKFTLRLNRALGNGKRAPDFGELLRTIGEFNAMVDAASANGKVAETLDGMSSLPLKLAECILGQVYARTVSPQVSLVRKYKNGTDDVYGELLPRFIHEIFRRTQLDSSKVFVDLGSGVGNVVMQAALEVGCESWGIEKMENPSKLARLQAKEMPARAKLWGINIGAIHLLEDDFLENKQIQEVLERAHVILVNNQAFTPELNNNLIWKFLDIRNGTKIVSLKSFAPSAKRNTEDPRFLFDIEKHEFGSGCVSWTDTGGEYFIHTKNSARMSNLNK